MNLTRLPFQYYEMSYGLNVEMHKQTEIGKRLDAIIRQVLPFLSGEHQQQVAMAVERAKQITMAELNAVMQVRAERVQSLQCIVQGAIQSTSQHQVATGEV